MIGTTIILEDQSDIPSLQISDNTTRPVVFSAFTSDKGTEDYIHIQGNKFFEQYGEISFQRHGQPLLQAANVINNGGILYAKRVVHPDSTLANFAVIAHLKEDKQQLFRYRHDENFNILREEVEENGVRVLKPIKDEEYWLTSDVALYREEADRPRYIKEEIMELGAADGFDTPITDPTTIDSDPRVQKAIINTCSISYSVESIDSDTLLKEKIGNDIKKLADYVLKKKGNALTVAEKFTGEAIAAGTRMNDYLLFVVTDNGRGVSNKRIRVSLDATLSRTAESARYKLDVYENDVALESMIFSLNPDELERGYNLYIDSVSKRSAAQIKVHAYEDQTNLFFQAVAKMTNIDENILKTADILNGKDYRGQEFAKIHINDKNEDGQTTTFLNVSEGHFLKGGDNGKWGRYPLTYREKLNTEDARKLNKTYRTPYDEEMKKAFDGTFSDDIFNTDNTPIDVVVDANYALPVKTAIVELCKFRQDVFFFRDYGIGMNTLLAIKSKKDMIGGIDANRSRFVADYCQSYDIYDPYTNKQITVTIGYDIARLICMHFGNGRNLVCAGEANSWIIPNVIDKTVSFIPKVTPTLDQQTKMEDMRVNYGMNINNVFTMVSEYTSQDRYTQLSFINNVLTVQELIKEIRKECPKSRYKFITGQDFEKYKADVNRIIEKFKSKFASIELVMEQNTIYAANKIVYASIKVKFKDFVQYEIFRIIAIPVADNV